MMRATPILVALAALGAAASAEAAQSKAPGASSQCFFSRDVTGVQPVGDRQVNVRVRNREVYRIDLLQSCTNLRRPQRIIELNPTAGGASICTAAEATLAVHVDGFREECFVDKITKLTPDEIKALPKKELP